MLHQTPDLRPAERFRPLLAGLLWVGSALLLGALSAPALFNFVLRLGRQVDALTSLREIEFESVCSRAMLLSFLVLAYPCLTIMGKLRWQDVTFLGRSGWKSQLGQGMGVGLVSMGLLFLLGWLTGAYRWQPDGGLGDPGRWLGIILGGLAVGFIEEVLFRGMLFGALRRAWGPWAGMLLAAFIFAAVHFAKPLAPEGVVYGYWHSGLSLLQHLFHTGHSTYHYFPYALTLFVMGLVLCLFYQRQRHLYFVIGLHAGWIMLMRLGGYAFERAPTVHPVLFGESMVVAKSYMALLLSLAFAVYVRATLFRKHQAGPPHPC